jgi:hypothetical protein
LPAAGHLFSGRGSRYRKTLASGHDLSQQLGRGRGYRYPSDEGLGTVHLLGCIRLYDKGMTFRKTT